MNPNPRHVEDARKIARAEARFAWDQAHGIVRHPDCDEPSQPSRESAKKRWCHRCRRTFNAPAWAMEDQRT